YQANKYRHKQSYQKTSTITTHFNLMATSMPIQKKMPPPLTTRLMHQRHTLLCWKVSHKTETISIKPIRSTEQSFKLHKNFKLKDSELLYQTKLFQNPIYIRLQYCTIMVLTDTN